MKTRCVRCAPDPGDEEMDTEGDALSGVSRKHSMRSSSCWFTEFCKSQCLSHFAAPFIVVRAETSVAENCISKEGRGCTDRGLKHVNENGNRNKEHPVLLPSSPTRRRTRRRRTRRFEQGVEGRAWLSKKNSAHAKMQEK